jgi:hypothetical protein
MNRNRIAQLIVLALCLPVAARADEASHRAKAEEMVTLLQTEKQVRFNADNIMKQVSEAADSAAGPNPTDDAKARIADFEKQAQQMIDGQVGWKALQTQFADAYAKIFTDDQLDAINAFYKSPAGLALVANMPDVNAQISQLVNGRMQALKPQLQQLYTDLKKSLAPAPPTLGPVPPATLGPVPPAAPQAPASAPAAPAATTPK